MQLVKQLQHAVGQAPGERLQWGNCLQLQAGGARRETSKEQGITPEQARETGMG